MATTKPRLTSDQKGRINAILLVGCGRETAAKYVGCSIAQLREEMLGDPGFAEEICRAEASAELMHMKNVQKAVGDEKNWRASVWWLERRAPERYGRRDPDALTPKELESFVAMLATAVVEDVRDAADRQRLLDRLRRLAESVDRLPSIDRGQPGGYHEPFELELPGDERE
jgi:hypothetical protein